MIHSSTNRLCMRGIPIGLMSSNLSRVSLIYHCPKIASCSGGKIVVDAVANAGSFLSCRKSANVITVRTVSLSSCDLKNPGKPSGINQSKSMFKYTRKFLDGGIEEPELVYNTETGRPNPSFKKTYISLGTSPRRLQVLNKLFFDHIRDVMTSGMFADHLIGCNFHVTKVRVLGGLIGIHVYYIQTGSDPEPTPEMLKNVARQVRKELHNLAITSNIPPITFKRDTSFENVFEVERRLAIIAQMDEQQREQGELEAVDQLRLTAPSVPDEIFEDDFKYDPSSPLNFAAATAQCPNPKNKPRSRFTPFAPRFSYKREQHRPNPTWNRPERVQWAGPAPKHSVPRQVPLLTNTFNLNRAAVMNRVEQGLARVTSFKNDGIDINVYEANLMDLRLDRQLLEGNDTEQQRRWEPVIEIMPRSALQHWAAYYTKKHVKDKLHGRAKSDVSLTAGEPNQFGLRDEDFDDFKYYEFEEELHHKTEAPDYSEDD